MTQSPTAVRSRPSLISAREYGRIELDPLVLLGSDGKLTLTPGVLGKYVRADFSNNELRLSAMGVTGLLPLNDDLMVQVKPRFPLRNLSRMVSECGYVPTVLSALRHYTVSDTLDDWMLDVMADALLAAFETITLNGLLRTYHRRTETSSYPHGRFDMTGTALLNAAHGTKHTAKYSWFERTVDNEPNRCLKSALTVLHRRYLCTAPRSGSRSRVARLGDALRVLHAVTLETRPSSLADPQVRGVLPLPENRSHYRPALELAVAILTGRGISLDAPDGTLGLQSLLVKTEDLFEDFVRLNLQRRLVDRPGLHILDGNKAPGKLPLYENLAEVERSVLPEHNKLKATSREVNPDIVFRLSDGTYPIVADVKYTEVRDYAGRSEVEQVVLYGLRYRSPVALTIHPLTEGSSGLYIAGKIGSVVIADYRVDLAAPDLDAEMQRMAERLSEFTVL